MSQRARVVSIVTVGVFVASLDLFIVNIAFPDIQRDLSGASLSSLSWILNAYAIVFAALLVPAGRWADRTGRKRAFVSGLALFTLSSAACAVAPSVGVLVAARVVQAAGAAVLTPAALGLLLPEFPPHQRGVAVGIWGAVSGVAAASGPVLGGLLVELSWRWVFVVNVPIGVIALIAATRVLSERREEAGAPLPDLAGSALLIGAVATLIGAIVEGPDWGWGDARVLALFAVAVVLLAGFARRSVSHPVPVVEPALVRVRAFAASNVASVFFFVGFGPMLLGSVLWLTEVWHESTLTAGLQIAPGPSTAALCAVASGLLIGRIGPRVTGMIGGALFAVMGVWWATCLGSEPHYLTGYLPGILIGGVGVGFVNPSLVATATARLPHTRLATGSAVLTMARQLGSALGVALFVAVLGTPARDELVHAFRDVWLLVAAGGAFAALGFAAVGTLAQPEETVAEEIEEALGSFGTEVAA